MTTIRQNPGYSDGTPGATDRIIFESSGNAPQGCAPATLKNALAIAVADVTGLQTALDAKHSAVLTDDDETASFTFALPHAQKMVRCNHATVAITATVPANASVAFPLGTVLNVVQWGAAAVTIAAGGGVTVNKAASKTFVLAERYAVGSLWKQATDTWVLFGHLTDV